MTPITITSTDVDDRTTMLPYLATDPFGATDDGGHDDEPRADALLVLAVDRIERHYTRRPAMDGVGVFGSGPRSGRAPTSFDVLGAHPVADGRPTGVVVDGLRWTAPDLGDDWV